MLYLVATPIGNLGDITARALDVLRTVDVIAAEDTRVTRKLLSHYAIKTHLISYHEHSGAAAIDAIVRRMTESGQSVALVTDAGTPAISDPGYDLVSAALDAGAAVTPIPGPAAFVAALVGSGLPTARFLFEGFLPRTKSTRLQKLSSLKSEVRTLIFYESPHRIGATLREIADVLGGDRRACVARELTKMFEEFRRATLAELAAHYSGEKTRGECVLVVAGLEPGKVQAGLPAVDSGDGLESEPARGKDLIKQLADDLGVPKRDVYQMVLELKGRKGRD